MAKPTNNAAPTQSLWTRLSAWLASDAELAQRMRNLIRAIAT